MSIKIYGASDDLIEVEGDIDGEVNATINANDVFVASDGTVASVVYGDGGMWKIEVWSQGTNPYWIKQATIPDDDDYSDVLTIEGTIRWVKHLSPDRSEAHNVQ